MFSTEQEMSLMFEKFLKSNFGNAYIKEYRGLFGIPDFLFYFKENKEISIVSFELKLRNWKKAAKQAFRYKSFSNISYVVISSENINSVLNNISLFRKYNIGLAKFNKNGDFEILYKPESGIPYSLNLSQKLINSLGTSKKKAKNIEALIK